MKAMEQVARMLQEVFANPESSARMREVFGIITAGTTDLHPAETLGVIYMMIATIREPGRLSKELEAQGFEQVERWHLAAGVAATVKGTRYVNVTLEEAQKMGAVPVDGRPTAFGCDTKVRQEVDPDAN